MTYEYQVLTAGGSSFDNLERIGNHLQEVLNGDDSAYLLAKGWELWQVNTIHEQGVNGVVLIYRRAKV